MSNSTVDADEFYQWYRDYSYEDGKGHVLKKDIQEDWPQFVQDILADETLVSVNEEWAYYGHRIRKLARENDTIDEDTTLE